MTTLDEQLTAWAGAELKGDAHALGTLLHPDFLAVGPVGFVLNREQWLQRFTDGLNYTAFAFAPDTDTRYIGGNAFVIGTQTQQGSYRGHPIDGIFRVTLVFTGDPEWRIVAAHISLRTPPGAPAHSAPPA
ncbi:nuclear transport factor 2 family protein [Streptomyces sp. NPDC059373]